jgi:hypothetical protein
MLFFHQIYPPPRQTGEVQWRATSADGASRAAPIVARNFLRFENPVALPTEHIVPQRPLSPRTKYGVFVQPFDPVACVSHFYVHCFHQDRIHLQAILTCRRRSAAAAGGNCFPGDNWQFCRSLDDAMILSAAFTARMGWLKAGCEPNAVCAVIADAVAA